MKKKTDLQPLPTLTNDAESEDFIAEADLTKYDLSGFRPHQFEFERKAAQINLRVPQSLLDRVKSKAEARGLPFTRYIRLLLEEDVSRR